MGPLHSFWDHLVQTVIFSFLLLSGCWSPCSCLARLDGDIRYLAIDFYRDDEEMLNAFCFQGDTPVHQQLEGVDSSTRQMCCHVLWSALEKEKDGTQLLDRRKVHQECLKQGTAFPTYSDDSASLLPVYAFFYNSNRVIPTTHNAASLWRVPPENTAVLPTSSKRSVWDSYGRKGRWVSLDDDDALHFQSWLDGKNNDMDDSTASIVKVHLESQLLPSGGMHRDLRHRITIQNGSPAAAAHELHHSVTTTLIMSLQIPSDLFVNVEDLVRVETAGAVVVGSVRLVRDHTTVIIDQEEPAFVSPPHALLLEITIAADTTKTTLFEFVTKLHVRYPLPVSGDDEGSFRLVVMPPPRLLAATSTSHSESITTTIMSSRHERPLSLWVAAGRQEHYKFILGVTLLASVVGAVIMLRDIARISTWN